MRSARYGPAETLSTFAIGLLNRHSQFRQVIFHLVERAHQDGLHAELGCTLEVDGSIVQETTLLGRELRTLGVRRPSAALLFTCNGRGSRLFDRPDHDASLVSSALHDAPLAGFFCAGELGPVGGKNFLHGFTASLLLFLD